MSAFAVLRHSRNLARMVLAGFLLTLSCAIAAPAFNPQSMALVCSASGDVRLVVVGDGQGDELPPALHQTLDCVLCLAAGAPPPQPSADGLTAALPAGPVVARAAQPVPALTATTPPARGPPAVS